VDVRFLYQLIYKEADLDVEAILGRVETNLGNFIIPQAFPACAGDDRRHLRSYRFEHRSGEDALFFQMNPIAWMTSSPKDSINKEHYCEEEQCVYVNGAFKASVSSSIEEASESQVTFNGDDTMNMEDVRANLLALVKSTINSGQLTQSTNRWGVQSIKYVEFENLLSLRENGDDSEYTVPRGRIELYLGLSVVIAAMIGMVGVGSLMKKCRDRGIEDRHHPLEKMRGTELDRNALKDYDESSTLVSNEESLWSRGWNNVTHVYDSAVEVCVEKLDLNRQTSF